uniref:Peptidase A1 domain-containing protein n=1 Tax=Bursaphelenchus xylophilus TaxID=6326 RepID=A0A1I7SBL2_BURXY
MSQAARKCRCWPQMSAARKAAARKKNCPQTGCPQSGCPQVCARQIYSGGKYYYLRLDFQTNYTFIINPDCREDLPCNGVKTYSDPRESVTFKFLDDTVEQNFNGSAISSELAVDKFQYRSVRKCSTDSTADWDHLVAPKVIYPPMNHAVFADFGLINRTYDFITAFHYDGALGLAPSETRNSAIYSLLGEFAGPVLLLEPKSSRGKFKYAPNVLVGTTRSDLCFNDWNLVQNVDLNSWRVNLTKVEVHFQSVNGNFIAQVDPFSTGLGLKKSIYDKILQFLSASTNENGTTMVRCNEEDSLHSVSLSLDDVVLNLNPAVYLKERLEIDGQNYCTLKFTELEENLGYDVFFGEEVLNEHCLLFDYNRPQIGLVRARKTFSTDFWKREKETETDRQIRELLRKS